MPDPRPLEIVRFGPFALDLATADLHTNGRKMRLSEQQFQILEMLLRGQGKLVTREEIRKRLWPNDTVVEFDRSINAAIKRLRFALGDSADAPRFIETVSSRGYRISVEVHLPEIARSAQPARKIVDGSLTGQTVAGWHRAGFKAYWKWISGRSAEPGRRPISQGLRQLISRMAAENPTWGAPRIHGDASSSHGMAASRMSMSWL